MDVITRSHKKSAVHYGFLENPLILGNILEHLEAKDALNLLITKAPFTKEERFLDTLDIFVAKKKEEYEKEYANFRIRTHGELTKFYVIKSSGGSTAELVIQMRSVLNLMNKNQWFLRKENRLISTIEIMLLKHLNSVHFQKDTLFFLGELFNIFVQSDNNDRDKYVITSKGEKMYLI